jgi:hypothetical protein
MDFWPRRKKQMISYHTHGKGETSLKSSASSFSDPQIYSKSVSSPLCRLFNCSSTHSPPFSISSLLFFNSVFFSMSLPAHSAPWPLIQFRNNFSQTVGLLGRVISPSQGRYLNKGQHKHRINVYTRQTSMPWVGFAPTIPAARASEGSSCLRSRGYCDRLFSYIIRI